MKVNSQKLINKTPLMYPQKIQRKFLPKSLSNQRTINLKKGPLLYIGLASLFMLAGIYIERATRTDRTMSQLKYIEQILKNVPPKTQNETLEGQLSADTVLFNSK